MRSLEKKGLRRIGRFFLSHKQAFSKAKKGVSAGLEPFFVPKMAQDASVRGDKSRPGGAKISPGGELPPYFPRL